MIARKGPRMSDPTTGTTATPGILRPVASSGGEQTTAVRPPPALDQTLPRVHFFVPFYGSPRFLVETVEAVRRSEDTRWRLTIVDDGWPTTEIEDHLARLGDPRIRYLRNETRQGTAGNLFTCIRMARERSEAPYVTFLGADDIVEPNYVDVVTSAFRWSSDAVMVQPAVTVIDESGEVHTPLADRVKRLSSWSSRRRGVVSGEHAVRQLMRANWLYWPSVSVRRDVLGRTHWRADIDGISDFAHAIDILIGGGSLVLESALAFRYRRHPTNDSSTRARSGVRWEQEKRYYQEVAAALRVHGWTRAARAADLHLSSRLHAAQVRLMAATAAVHARLRRAG